MNFLLQYYPDNPPLMMTRALLEAESGKARQGLARIDKALGTNPESYPLMATRAEILLKQQNYTDACNELQKLSHLRPNDPDIWFQLAEAQGLVDDIIGLHQFRAEYFFLNGSNTDDAIKHLQYAVKMAGDNLSP